jgi:hypothetical protein
LNKRWKELILDIKRRAFEYNELTKKEGFMSLLNNNLDKKSLVNKEILEYSLLLLLWKDNDDLFDLIITNEIEKEKNKQLRYIKNIEKEIALKICDGISEVGLELLIDSFISIDNSVYKNFLNKHYFNL